MQTSESEIVFTIVATLIVLLGLGFFIIGFMFFYQKRRHAYQQNLMILKQNYEKETVKAQLEIQEETMQSIAREIHDNIGQILSLVKLNLNAIDLQEQEIASTQKKLNKTKDLVGKAIHDLRGLSKMLNSDVLADTPLTENIELVLKQFPETANLRVSFYYEGNFALLDVKEKIIVFRIFQELLNNAIKHAQASLIEINLNGTKEKLTLEVKDNGKGIDEKIVSGGSGIKNMQYRAKLMGATLKWQNRKPQGTIFSLHYTYKIPEQEISADYE